MVAFDTRQVRIAEVATLEGSPCVVPGEHSIEADHDDMRRKGCAWERVNGASGHGIADCGIPAGDARVGAKTLKAAGSYSCVMALPVDDGSSYRR